MRKKLPTAVLLVGAVLSGGVLAVQMGQFFLQVLLPHWVANIMSASASEAASVGIIGGADGPTQVFVTGSPVPAFLGLAGFALAVATFTAFIVLLAYRRKSSSDSARVE